VAEIESTHDLRKNFPNELLANIIISLDAAFDYLLQVTTLAILHYYVYLKVALVHYSVIIAHDVWVLQFPQNIDFRDNLLFFLFVHLSVVQFFPYKHLAIRLAFNFAYNAKTTY
jgi:hypothetical protein